MNVNGKKLCNNCFQPTHGDVCKECGYKRTTYKPQPGIIPLGKMLNNRYVVGKVLGKGGFGITYKALDNKEKKIVAVKEYYPSGVVHRDTGTTKITVTSQSDEETFKIGADKFFEEAKLIARFNGNPNIVSVREFFYENGTVYFVMEYLDGTDLKRFIKLNGGKLSQEKVLYVANVVTDALVITHSLNVLHRDISPDNIFIEKDGNIKLIDFGAARQVLAEQSKSLSVILKQGFAPLEQYQRRGKQGPWTDIYAIGASLYYCLTGKAPDEVTERLDFPEIGKADEFGVDESFWNIIEKALAVKKEERYQSVIEMKADLNRLEISPCPLVGRSNNMAMGTVAVDESADLVDELLGETVAVGVSTKLEDELGETVAVKEPDELGETVAVNESNELGETVAVNESNELGETVAVNESNELGETVAVKETNDIDDVTVTDTQEDDEENKLLLIWLNYKKWIVLGASVVALILILLISSVFFKEENKKGKNSNGSGRNGETIVASDATENDEESSSIDDTEESTQDIKDKDKASEEKDNTESDAPEEDSKTPTESKTTEGKTTESKTTEGKTTEGKTTEGKTTETKTTESHEHSYKTTTTKNATCENAGEQLYECSCGHSYVEKIAPTGHIYSVVKSEESTCQSQGYKNYKCNSCGDTYTETLSYGSHTWGDWITQSPTCTEYGFTERACTTCGEVENTQLSPFGHSMHTTRYTLNGVKYVEVKCSVYGCGYVESKTTEE